MPSRQTNNSRSVSLFSETSQVSVSAGADASSHSSTASTSSPAAATFPATNVPDPAFLTAVVNAVKVALAAEKTPPSSDGATVPVAVPDLSCSSSLRVSGGVPSQADLSARTATFLSSGLGFSSSQAASSSPASSASFALPPVSSVSPLNADKLCRELATHPDQQQVAFVLQGIRHGFKLGFQSTHRLRPAKKNKPSAFQHAKVVDEYLANEVSLGRVAGPFNSPPVAPLAH